MRPSKPRTCPPSARQLLFCLSWSLNANYWVLLVNLSAGQYLALTSERFINADALAVRALNSLFPKQPQCCLMNAEEASLLFSAQILQYTSYLSTFIWLMSLSRTPCNTYQRHIYIEILVRMCSVCAVYKSSVTRVPDPPVCSKRGHTVSVTCNLTMSSGLLLSAG